MLTTEIPPQAAVTANQPWRARVRSLISYIYFLRFAIVLWVLPLGLFFLDAFTESGREMVHGILVQSSYWHFFWSCFAGFLAGSTAWILARLVLAYGGERFCLSQPWSDLFLSSSSAAWFSYILAMLPAGFFNVYLWRISELAPSGNRLPFIFSIGLVATACITSFLLLVILSWLYYFLHRPTENAFEVKAVLLPVYWGLKSDPAKFVLFAIPLKIVHFLSVIAARILGPGYVRPDGKDKGTLHGGHVFALSLMFVYAVLYAAGYEFLLPKGAPGSQLDLTQLSFPVVGFVWILAIAIFWTLGGLAFFLDRFHVPLAVVLTLVGFLVPKGLIKPSDHFYHVMPFPQGQDRGLAKPHDILAQWMTIHEHDNAPLIIVTATGGGIHAASWTAEALEGIANRVDKDHGAKTFENSVVLLSSVSGGSVGVSFYVDQQEHPATSRASLFDKASASSLEAVAWGLSFPDLLRIVPVFGASVNPEKDRGLALENAWASRYRGNSSLARLPAGLHDNVWRPAIALNATLAEAGQRFVLANYLPTPAVVGKDTTLATPTAPSFFDLYPEQDIALQTAARLSATFSYVTPMSRPNIDDGLALHVGDGGYYDNYGIATALEWLKSALCLNDKLQRDDSLTRLPSCQGVYSRAALAQGAKPRTILWIEIVDGLDTQPNLKKYVQPAWATSKQLLAPLSIMMRVRTAGQSDRNDIELDGFERLLPPSFRLDREIFSFSPTEKDASGNLDPDQDPEKLPLSWRLTPKQKNYLREEWATSPEIQDRLKHVTAAF